MTLADRSLEPSGPDWRVTFSGSFLGQSTVDTPISEGDYGTWIQAINWDIMVNVMLSSGTKRIYHTKREYYKRLFNMWIALQNRFTPLILKYSRRVMACAIKMMPIKPMKLVKEDINDFEAMCWPLNLPEVGNLWIDNSFMLLHNHAAVDCCVTLLVTTEKKLLGIWYQISQRMPTNPLSTIPCHMSSCFATAGLRLPEFCPGYLSIRFKINT